MLILVYGDDTFRVQEKVKVLQAAFMQKHDPTGFNLALFGADAKPGDILQAVGSLPFMSQKRMVVIRDLIASTKKDGEAMWASLAHTPESSIVVLWETAEPKAVEKKGLFQTLKKGADVHAYPFPVLEGAALSKWAAERVHRRGGAIAADAASELAERVGGDLWQMDNEIGKLVAYASGRTVAKADVEELVRASFDGEIFALVDAVSRKEAEKAIKLLQQERMSGASDFSIFGMLARQVRILLGARALIDELTTPNPSLPAGRQGLKRRGELEGGDLGRRGDGLAGRLASEMSLPPFVAEKAILHAKRYTLPNLRATHDLLFRYDAGMKSGYLDAELAVDLVTTALVR